MTADKEVRAQLAQLSDKQAQEAIMAQTILGKWEKGFFSREGGNKREKELWTLSLRIVLNSGVGDP